MASNNITKKEALSDLWALSRRNPEMLSRILDKLDNEYNISVDDFNKFDVQMQLGERAEEFKDIPGFSQSYYISDDEILRVFEARDELNAKIDSIGRPPTEAEWYKAGLDADQKIAILRPAYETKKEEEWGHLETMVPAPFSPLMGPIQALTELVGGPSDLRYDFKEDLHERGFGTSWNPLTGFGAWDIAEFKKDPVTGRRGFSSDLLQLEEELDQLYGVRNKFKEQYAEGGWEDIGGIEEEIGSLNQIIMEHELLDPRMLGEMQ